MRGTHVSVALALHRMWHVVEWVEAEGLPPYRQTSQVRHELHKHQYVNRWHRRQVTNAHDREGQQHCQSHAGNYILYADIREFGSAQLGSPKARAFATPLNGSTHSTMTTSMVAGCV